MIIKNRFGVPKRFFALYQKLDFLKNDRIPHLALSDEGGRERGVRLFLRYDLCEYALFRHEAD